ncbi:MAG: peptidylprolyl isomerase [Pseudomonadales bacterium]
MFIRLTLLLIAAGTPFSSYALPVMLDEIAAIVDDDVITVSEVKERAKAIYAQAKDPSQLPSDEVLTEQIVERLIVESLQLQMARRAGVRISDVELNEAMTRIAGQNQLSLAQFREALAGDGISYEGMRQQIEREIMIGRVQQGVMNSRIEISEQAITDFLDSDAGRELTADEYRVGHILLATNSDMTQKDIAQTKAKAEQLVIELGSGANFQTLAMTHSAGKNALEGGDLGWRKPAALPTLFSDLVIELQLEEVKGPIQSGSGFHIIKLLQKRGATAAGMVDQTRVRHVLINPNEIRSLEEAKALAESLREEVLGGRPFDEIARLYSEDPGSALKGGDLGWSTGSEFVGSFEAAIEATQINEVSPVFQSEFGFHFLEVTGRRTEDFSERFKRNQAANFLRGRSFDEEVDNWVREIREDAFVEVRL